MKKADKAVQELVEYAKERAVNLLLEEAEAHFRLQTFDKSRILHSSPIPEDYTIYRGVRIPDEFMEGLFRGKVLDFGCGMTPSPIYLAGKPEVEKVIGYDLSGECIALQRKNLKAEGKLAKCCEGLMHSGKSDRLGKVGVDEQLSMLFDAAPDKAELENIFHKGWVTELKESLLPERHRMIAIWLLQKLMGLKWREDIMPLLPKGWAKKRVRELGNSSIVYRWTALYPVVFKVLNSKLSFVLGKLKENDKLPFEDDYFDAINSEDVLHFVKNPFKLADEFARVCRKGGRAYIYYNRPGPGFESKSLYDFFIKVEDYLERKFRIKKFSAPGCGGTVHIKLLMERK